MTSRAFFPSLLLLLPLALVACSGEPAETPPGGAGPAPAEDVESFQGRVFERSIVFVSPRSDSVLLVPWLFTARTLPGGVRREARGSLARGGTWEPFFADQWETPPSRLPWRLLPRGQMGLVIGDEDALEQILFDEGLRQLEVVLQAPLAEWSGPRGETFRILEGTLVLSNTRVEGVVLDMNRGYPVREPPPGEWGFLVSGDSLQLFLHASEADAPGAEGAFRVWARLRLHELHWPDVTVSWGATRAFERARREVPVDFHVASDDAQMRAELSVVAAELQAGPGEDPLLPVDGLFEVTGTVRFGGVTYPVRGLMRHLQP